MEPLLYDAADEAATDRLGAALARVLPDGAVVALCGTLGAGKTRLVQAIAESSGVPRREVVSPTFVLVHEHRRGDRPIHHFDAYRIRDLDEFEELGPDEYYESGGLTLIEWADRVVECLPAERLEVRIEVTGAQSRRFKIIAHGTGFDEVLRALRAAVSC